MNTVSDTKLHTAGSIARRLCKAHAAGEVCGAFSHAVYCTFGEDVLLLHGSEWGEVPFGIALLDIVAFRSTLPCEAGDTAAFVEGGLQIGGRLFPCTLTEPPRPACAQLRLPSAKRLAEAENYVHTNGCDGGILHCIHENLAHAAESVETLSDALRADDGARASAAAVRLIGLGRGLTPSGDDYLCGFFTLLAAAEQCGIAVPQALAVCVNAVLQNLDRTSRISGAYLKNALDGAYFTVYDRAARALLTKEDFTKHCDFVLRMGASSGTDTLCGAIAAAKLLVGA